MTKTIFCDYGVTVSTFARGPGLGTGYQITFCNEYRVLTREELLEIVMACLKALGKKYRISGSPMVRHKR